MKILVTGHSGFIGQELVKECRNRGFDVVVPSTYNGTWRLGLDLYIPETSNITHAIHLAHDFAAVNQAEANVMPTIKAINQLRASGVGFQCFVSSFSAGAHARSSYGKSKFAIENLARGEDLTIVRPGLVIGTSGIWGKISGFVKRYRVAIIPGGGGATSPSIEVKELCDALLQICEEKKSGLFFVTADPTQTFKSLIRYEFSGFRYLEFHVPIWVIRAGLAVLEGLGIKAPVSRDNLEGFFGNQILSRNTWISKGRNLWTLD